MAVGLEALPARWYAVYAHLPRGSGIHQNTKKAESMPVTFAIPDAVRDILAHAIRAFMITFNKGKYPLRRRELYDDISRLVSRQHSC